MKVYALKATGRFGGGMAIIAAPNTTKARFLSRMIHNYWNIRYDYFDSIEELPVKYRGEAKVLVHYETGE